MKRPSILMPVVECLDVRTSTTSDSKLQSMELPIEFYQNLFDQFNTRVPQVTETLKEQGKTYTRCYVEPMAIYELFGVLAQEELVFIAEYYTDERTLKKKLFQLSKLLEALAGYLDDAAQEMVEETGVLAQIAQCFQMRYDPELYDASNHELLAGCGFQNAALSILPGLAMRIREFCVIFIGEVSKQYDLSAERRSSDDSLQSADLSSLSRYFDTRLQEAVADSFPQSRSLTPMSTPPPQFFENRVGRGRSYSDNELEYQAQPRVNKNSKSSLVTCVSASGLEPMTSKLGFWQKWRTLSTTKKWLFGALVLTEAVAIAVLAVFAPGSTLFTAPAASWMTMNILAAMSAGIVVAAGAGSYLISRSRPKQHNSKLGVEEQLLGCIKLKKNKVRQHYGLLAESIPRDWDELSSGSSEDSGNSDADESQCDSTPASPF